MNRLLTALCACALVPFIGCGNRSIDVSGEKPNPSSETVPNDGDGEAVEQDELAATVAATYGRRPHLHMICGAKVQPPKENSFTFDMHVDIDADGSAYVYAVKAGHDLFRVLVKPDLEAIIVLEKNLDKLGRVVTGNLAAVPVQGTDTLGMLMASIRYLIKEFRDGPVSPDLAWQRNPSDATLLEHTAEDGTALQVRIDPDSGWAKEKIYFASTDNKRTEILRLAYERQKTFSVRLLRPTRTRIRIPNNETRLRVSIREIEAPAKRDPLTIKVPKEWPVETIDAWMQRLRKEARESAPAQPAE